MVRIRIFALALVLAAACFAVTTAPASALARPRAVGLHGAPGATALSVQWKWTKTPTHYRVQVSRKKNFSSAVRTKVVKRAKKRPRRSRQVTTFKHLARATHYFYRVRAEKKKSHSAWSRVRSAWTKVPWPARMSNLRIVPGDGHGHGVGAATFTWHSSGAHTARFTISTALTHFSLADKRMPSTYRAFTFSARSARTAKPGVFRKTLTAAQLRAAHAPVASAHFLYAHLSATNANHSHTRPYPGMQAIVPLGMPASGTGDPITVANYNIRGYNVSERSGKPADAWNARKDRVVQNIVRADPDIVTLQEDGASKIGNSERTQASELLKALNAASKTHTYEYNRWGPFKKGTTGKGHTQATVLLYAADEFEQVPADKCTDQVVERRKTSSCAFVPGNDDRWASWVHLRQKDHPDVRFWVMSAHPNQGRSKKAERIRRDEIKAIVAKLDALRGKEPAILGMDSNTWQTYQDKFGVPSLSHNALIAGGYYDTAASANVAARTTSRYPVSRPGGATSTYRYSTGNPDYSKSAQRPRKNGYAPRIDVIATKGLPGADDFGYDHATRAWPGSDHNLVWARIRLPAPN